MAIFVSVAVKQDLCELLNLLRHKSSSTQPYILETNKKYFIGQNQHRF